VCKCTYSRFGAKSGMSNLLDTLKKRLGMSIAIELFPPSSDSSIYSFSLSILL